MVRANFLASEAAGSRTDRKKRKEQTLFSFFVCFPVDSWKMKKYKMSVLIVLSNNLFTVKTNFFPKSSPSKLQQLLNCLEKMNADSTPFRLTFGVELEFIVIYNPQDYQDELLAAEGKFWPAEFSPTLRQKYGILVSRRMIQMLNEHGFSTNDYRLMDFSKWTVDTDETVTRVDGGENWYAIELKTPVLDCSGPALKQVETVVELLDSRFKLYINESCGLHVHVGNEDRGFALPTLKTFCSLILAFRHQLDSLHPPERLENEFAKPMRMKFNPAASLRKQLSVIDNLETILDLISQFHYSEKHLVDRFLAFNFLNLQESHDKPFRTIEFRQHRGTVDPNLITHWVMVAYKLVDISHNDSVCLPDLIEKQIYNHNYTVVDLFRDLKLADLAEFYATHVFPQHGTD